MSDIFTRLAEYEEQLVQANRREEERGEVCTLRGAFRLVVCLAVDRVGRAHRADGGNRLAAP
jgi:hypothetical protein